ncbi:hypothetical protein [Dyella psychrodurans]|uniref:hypothetical protein n=1 Tax=Dyella psychrodurans TaxID=1927960 RepID=UPI0013145223|nr:hypothetical protein [Dyella psychrodurans]
MSQGVWASRRRLWSLLPSAAAAILLDAYFPHRLVFAILTIVIASLARNAFGLAELG